MHIAQAPPSAATDFVSKQLIELAEFLDSRPDDLTEGG
jgi:hypothetical protein